MFVIKIIGTILLLIGVNGSRMTQSGISFQKIIGAMHLFKGSDRVSGRCVIDPYLSLPRVYTILKSSCLKAVTSVLRRFQSEGFWLFYSNSFQQKENLWGLLYRLSCAVLHFTGKHLLSWQKLSVIC